MLYVTNEGIYPRSHIIKNYSTTVKLIRQYFEPLTSRFYVPLSRQAVEEESPVTTKIDSPACRVNLGLWVEFQPQGVFQKLRSLLQNIGKFLFAVRDNYEIVHVPNVILYFQHVLDEVVKWI